MSLRPAPAGTAPGFSYIPALDGLRAVSIGLVMLSHFGLGSFVPGGLGVTVFFFVSGYLITRQLLAEAQTSGTIRLLRFAARRALRLYPALLGMVILGGAVFAALGGQLAAGQFAAALLYWSNYTLLAGGFAAAAPALHPFSILWSLAVEEHFYLLFPVFALLWWRRPWGFVAGLTGLIIVVAAWRGALVWHCLAPASCHANIADRVAFGTDTRIDSILYGGLLAAVLAAGGAAAGRWFGSAWAAGLSVAAILASLLWREPVFRDVLRYSVQGLGLLGGIGWLLLAPAAARLRGLAAAAPLVWAGRLSYSLYLWHWLVIACASVLAPARINAAVLSGRGDAAFYLYWAPALLAASLAAASASYYGIERPLLGLRRRLGGHPVGPDQINTPNATAPKPMQ